VRRNRNSPDKTDNLHDRARGLANSLHDEWSGVEAPTFSDAKSTRLATLVKIRDQITRSEQLRQVAVAHWLGVAP
jgi:hypothetical protein